jgi:Ca2+-binding RTX toxin-like protein
MRRRAVLLITAVAVALVAVSGVTLAKDITCPTGPGTDQCMGTSRDDTMTGTGQDDDMDGLGGQDTLLALDGDDVLKGGAGEDSLSGGNNDDTYAFSADWGADRIPADGEGAGRGTDKLDFSSPLLLQPLDIDLVPSANRDEVYSVYSGAGTLNFPATVEIENVTGGTFRDVVRGNDVNNHLSGGAGNDSLYGRGGDDHLIGGPGADALVGGAGDDDLEGNLGVDTGVDTVYGDNPGVPTETGDDEIDVKDGLKDTVDCGPGTDTVFFDEGIDDVKNCE